MKKVLSVFLVMCMVFSMMPAAVYAEDSISGDNIYVAEKGSDDKDGQTEANAVLTIDRALELVNPGGKIIILDSADSVQPAENIPLYIDKAVTITGGILDLNYAGIVLGADVTIDGVELAFANKVRNAIMANGYVLTLKDVVKNKNVNNTVHLFCGGLMGYTNFDKESGSSGEIIIQGKTALGNIYAGNISSDGNGNTWDHSSVITFDNDFNGDIGEIYACGALETFVGDDSLLDPNYIVDPPTPNSSMFPVKGGVTINLNRKTAVVDGMTGGSANAVVNYKDGTGNAAVHTLKNIGTLVLGGEKPNLFPKEGSTLDAEASVTVPSGSTLNLTNLTNNTDTDTLTIGSFTGGGALIMGEEQTLTITGTVDGTTTAIAIDEVDLYNCSSGDLKSGNTYLKAPASRENDFVFPAPYSYGDTVTDLVRNENGVWVAAEIEITQPDIREFSIQEKNIDVTDATKIEIPVIATYGPIDASQRMAYAQFKVNGTRSDYGICEVDGMTFMFNYSYRKTDWSVEEYLYIDTVNGTTIPMGEYTITIESLDEDPVTSVTINLTDGNEETKYTVTYDANGGSGAAASATVTEGESHTVSGRGELTREGYEFTGWNTAADGSGESYVAGTSVTVNGDLTLYAQWKETKDPAADNIAALGALKSILENHNWTVAQETANTEETVKAWIEKQISAMELSDAEFAVKMTSVVPAQAGALSDPDGTNGSFSFEVTLSKGSDEAYAETTVAISGGVITATVYVPAKYTVTYDANGGSGAAASVPVTEGESHTVSGRGELTREGYEFTGWNTAADGSGESYVAGTSVTVNGDLTLYAQWKETKDPAADNIAALGALKSILENHNWTVAQETANTEETVKAWIEKQISAMELSDAEFAVKMTSVVPAQAGALSDPDGTNGSFSFEVTLSKGSDEAYAETTVAISGGVITATVYVPAKYTVTYDANGGSGAAASVPVTEGESHTVSGRGELTREGYEFTGWNTAADGSGESYVAGTSVVIDGDLTLYAQWVLNTYSVTVAAEPGEGGTVSGGGTYDHGEFVTVNAVLSVGYIFKGWQENGQVVFTAPEYTFTATKERVLTAVFEKTPSCTLKYDANGAYGSVPTGGTALKGTEFTVAEQGVLRKSGYEFVGWNTKANGTGISYQPDAAITLNSDVTLYAQWRMVNSKVSGEIKAHKAEYTSITVRLDSLDGIIYVGTVGEGVTNNSGNKTLYPYTVNAPKGTYTLYVIAVTTEGVTVTRNALVTLGDAAITQDFNLPDGQAKSKKSEVKIDKDAPQILAGGLDVIIDQEEVDPDTVAVELTLVVKAVEETSQEAAKIHEQVVTQPSSQEKLEFVELTVEKVVTDKSGEENRENLSNLSELIQIVIPFDCNGRNNIQVYRYHEGTVDTLTTIANEDGEKIEVYDTYIVLYSKKFSTYAIGFTEEDKEDEENEPPQDPGQMNPPVNSDFSGSADTPEYQVNMPEYVEHGEIKVSSKSAESGELITISVKSEDGYRLSELKVTDATGKNVDLTDAGKGTFTFRMPSGKVTIYAAFVPVVNEWVNGFKDVAPGAWYYDAVGFMVQNGWMSGYDDTTFAVNDDLSRAQLVQILYSVEGKPSVETSKSFQDVSGKAWFADAVEWASGLGIVSGYGDGRFGPNDAITREQLAAILYHYAGHPQIEGQDFEFSDLDAVSAYAVTAVQWAVENGIISGTGNNLLSPGETASRAQVAQMLKNYLEDVKN